MRDDGPIIAGTLWDRAVICGIVRRGRGPFGIEFICVREPHDTEKQRSRRRSQLGYYPQSERHHFVRRWTNGGTR